VKRDKGRKGVAEQGEMEAGVRVRREGGGAITSTPSRAPVTGSRAGAGFFNFNSSKLVFEPLDDVNLKSHEYPKFITRQDLQILFRSFLHLTKCYKSLVQN
jgi:hypothetical protein